MSRLGGSHGVRQLLSVSYGVRRRLLQYYSTSSSSSASAAPLWQTHFKIEDYLVNSLGFSRAEAISASAKVTRLKSPENPDLVLNFFHQLGLNSTQIGKIVSSAPTLLVSNVDKTLKPKFKVLQDLGLSVSDIVKLTSGDSDIFRRGLDTTIVPSIDYLRKLLGSDEKVVAAIRKFSWLLAANASKRMPPNVLWLQECGFSDERIVKFIIQNPRHFMQKPQWLKDVVHRVEVELGIPRDSPIFFRGIVALGSNSKSTLDMKFGIFKSFGWSHSDITTMARILPLSLSLSEAKIRKGLNFFMNELGYAPAYLASHPTLLSHSLEKRVVPRYEVLKILEDKKLIKSKPSLYSVVTYPELKFIKNVVLPYKDEIPDLYEAYASKMGL